MAYSLVFSKEADKQVSKLDPGVRRVLLKWLEKNVDGSSDPRAHGKALSANRAGQWRYRIGDYRAICIIEDDRLVVLCITVAHRRAVYD
ncbi:MAG: type II toxin-antitoxin system RelE/ParE family toxin [Bacilli bacterium]|nr:type II toxin-antitoxin system RelE/ParE family toxin [Bacilli bacterium]MDY6392149.1 type II toxin-antitoxin system RelE/ParE family toxin [Bacilli bacterium]